MQQRICFQDAIRLWGSRPTCRIQAVCINQAGKKHSSVELSRKLFLHPIRRDRQCWQIPHFSLQQSNQLRQDAVELEDGFRHHGWKITAIMQASVVPCDRQRCRQPS